MKKIEAIINTFKLDAVRRALDSVGIEGLTVSEVKGFGHQKGMSEAYRGTWHVVESLPRLKLETLVNDFKASQIVEAIKQAAHTGCVGDGKVFVSAVDEVIRIRTGERGSDAL